MNTSLNAAVWLVLLATAASPAQMPLGTAFTDQGRFNQAGQPFNSSAELVFGLCRTVAGDNSGSGSVALLGNLGGGSSSTDLPHAESPPRTPARPLVLVHFCVVS
jgi:hypothetical protein